MKASIIIVSYNRPDLLSQITSQITDLSPDLELVVIDQSATTPNLCAGRNQGIAKSTGEIIIFFDDDVELTADTISAHLEAYNDPNIQAVAGRVVNDGEVVPSDSDVVAGKINSFLTQFTKNFWSTRYQIVQFVYGCNMSFRRSALMAAGGFDEALPTPLSSFEEIDMSLRVSKLGLIQFVPDAFVYHHRSVSGGTRMSDLDRSHQYYASYGMIIKKHLDFPISLISIVIILFRLIKSQPSSIRYFLSGLLQKQLTVFFTQQKTRH